MSAIGAVLRGENRIDFVRWWRRGIVLSVVLVLVSIGALVVRGLELSVDFTGGVAVEVRAPGVSADEARQAVSDAGLGGAKVQIVGADIVRVQTSADTPEAQQALRESMAELADLELDEISVSAVSPAWGEDITGQMVRALVFFLIAISLYLTIRLELKMAVGALIAVVHDIIISVGVYALFQFEVSPGTVIAFLTILGYSIYDTVVVYDKVKENEARAGISARLTYTEMVSLSMNQVLLRSLNTTITSMIPVVSLLVVGMWMLGAVTLGQFAIALLVGLAVGAYSSIMVAAPAVAFLKEREPHYRALRERLQAAGGGRTAVTVGTGGRSTPAAPTASAGPVATPVGAIPPRPRKQGKKR